MSAVYIPVASIPFAASSTSVCPWQRSTEWKVVGCRAVQSTESRGTVQANSYKYRATRPNNQATTVGATPEQSTQLSGTCPSTQQQQCYCLTMDPIPPQSMFHVYLYFGNWQYNSQPSTSLRKKLPVIQYTHTTETTHGAAGFAVHTYASSQADVAPVVLSKQKGDRSTAFDAHQ